MQCHWAVNLKTFKINKMEKTLLQQAIDLNPERKDKKPLSVEEYELGVAWARGRITYRQIQTVMGYKNINSVYGLISKCFERYVYLKEAEI